MEERIGVMGVQINIWRGGRGTPLVLLPGWNGTFKIYEDLLEALSRGGFDVYGIESPGAGKSDAPPKEWAFDDFVVQLEGVFDHYGITQAVVVGHSFGCVSALKFAGRFSEKTKKLVLVNSPNLSRKEGVVEKIFDAGFLSFASLLKPAKWAVATFKVPLFGFLAYRVWRNVCSANAGHTALKLLELCAWISFLYSIRGALKPANLHYAADWLDRQYHFLADGDGVMRRVLRVVIETDTAEDAQRVRAPTLIVAGGRGGITPPSNADILRENIPDSEFFLIPNGPHHFKGEWATILARTVADWVKNKEIKITEQPL